MMGSKKTILVGEDNPLNMKLVVDLLELNGFQILKAVDGASAQAILNNGIPDLVILDIRLPDIDGFEVLRRIRADERLKHLKVVALTAQPVREEDRIRNAGFDIFISKPFSTKDFIAQIKRMVADE